MTEELDSVLFQCCMFLLGFVPLFFPSSHCLRANQAQCIALGQSQDVQSHQSLVKSTTKTHRL